MTGWDALARFLADPGTHGAETHVIDTHTARVVLAGQQAWKLRRAVDYGWLDYSTRARRRLCAEREIAWNAPSAPGLYLGLGGIGEGPRLIPPGEGVPEAAEPLVVMRRFDTDRLFDRMAASGGLDAALMARTGRAVAAMHRREAPRERTMDVAGLAAQEADELDQLAAVFDRDALAGATRAIRTEAARRAPMPERPVRRCHGDLHLRNIVLWREAPAPFDCIEFNTDFSHIDPLYDLAFLLMDLDNRDLGALAPGTLSAWAEAMAAEPDAEEETAYGGLALLPLYRAIRAGIRAKITGLALRDGVEGDAEVRRAEAGAYLRLARRYIEARPAPRLVAVGGRSGTGKSTLARALAGRLGAVILRSDGIRKGLWGVAETEPLPEAAYAPEVSERVYATMRRRAGVALAAGLPAILDAAHLGAEERAGAAALATEAGVPFAPLWLEGDPAALAARVAARGPDASDADAAVVERQFDRDLGQIAWPALSAAEAPEVVARRAMDMIGAEDTG
jgi:hypothetical protein